MTSKQPRQAYSLDVLLAEVNTHAPGRNKASDGGIGDARHQAEKSDHNPNAEGVWRAYDFTHDPKKLPGKDLATRLAAMLGHHPAMLSGAYVIWNRRIISFDRIKEGWRSYSGSDPHTGHVHLSVSTRALYAEGAGNYDTRQHWNLWSEVPQTRVTKARALLQEAADHAGPERRAKIEKALAAIKDLDNDQ